MFYLHQLYNFLEQQKSGCSAFSSPAYFLSFSWSVRIEKENSELHKFRPWTECFGNNVTKLSKVVADAALESLAVVRMHGT